MCMHLCLCVFSGGRGKNTFTCKRERDMGQNKQRETKTYVSKCQIAHVDLTHTEVQLQIQRQRVCGRHQASHTTNDLCAALPLPCSNIQLGEHVRQVKVGLGHVLNVVLKHFKRFLGVAQPVIEQRYLLYVRGLSRGLFQTRKHRYVGRRKAKLYVIQTQ